MAERKKITIVGAGNVGATAAHCFFLPLLRLQCKWLSPSY